MKASFKLTKDALLGSEIKVLSLKQKVTHSPLNVERKLGPPYYSFLLPSRFQKEKKGGRGRRHCTSVDKGLSFRGENITPLKA